MPSKFQSELIQDTQAPSLDEQDQRSEAPTPEPTSDATSQDSRLRRTRDWLLQKRSRWLVISLLVISCALLVTLGRSKVDEEMNRPLGPTLPPFPTPSPRSSEMSEAPATITPAWRSGEDTQVILPQPIRHPTATPEPLCGGPEQMIVLAVGADTTSGYIRGLADVIRVVHVDFVTPRISVLSVPRDLWVSIPGLGEHGHELEAYFGHPLDPDGEEIDLPGDYGRINVAYFFGNLYALPGGGPSILAQALYQNFGLPVDHYIAVNMTVLAAAIDAVGGIDIVVPYSMGDFSSGQQHMTGEEALAYARIRELDNDWYRSSRQNQVLWALRDKLLQPQTFTAVPSLVDTFLDDTLTDLSRAQITSLVCIATQVEDDDIVSYPITPDMVTATLTTRGSYILLPNEGQIRELVGGFLDATH